YGDVAQIVLKSAHGVERFIGWLRSAILSRRRFGASRARLRLDSFIGGFRAATLSRRSLAGSRARLRLDIRLCLAPLLRERRRRRRPVAHRRDAAPLRCVLGLLGSRRCSSLLLWCWRLSL